MVLDYCGRDDVLRLEAEPVGQMVDGVGGVATDDRHVVGVRAAPREAQGRGPGLLVGVRGLLGLVARPPVHARIPRQELADPFRHRR